MVGDVLALGLDAPGEPGGVAVGGGFNGLVLLDMVKLSNFSLGKTLPVRGMLATGCHGENNMRMHDGKVWKDGRSGGREIQQMDKVCVCIVFVGESVLM